MEITVDIAKMLIAEQFPEWAHLPITPTATALPFILLGLTASGDLVGTVYLAFDYSKEVIKNLLRIIY